MKDLYTTLKTDLEEFTKALHLLTYAHCCKPDGPEVKKLAAITSFKSSLFLFKMQDLQGCVDCFIYRDIVSHLNAVQNIAQYKATITPDECIMDINYDISRQIQLKFGLYDWTLAEIDLILDKITTEGVFNPHVREYT
jgi:hypothetical protein